MKKENILNMTEGHPMRLLAIFSLPMLIGNIFQQAYSFADSVIVGRFIGSSALAAVGATGSVTFLFFSICNGIGSGCGIVTSQYFGAGNDREIRQAISNSAYLMFLSALAMGIAAFFAAPLLLRLTKTPADILSDALAYMRISCIGVPLIAVYNYSSSMLRALGDSKTPLYFLVVSCFLNILIDLLFVCVFHMGVSGAGLATVIAQMIAGIGCMIYAIRRNHYFRLSREDWRYNKAVTKKAVRLGLPLAMQWSMIAVSSTALQTFVNSFGTVAVAAYTAVNRFEQLLYQPYNSLSTGMSTYAGQNYGAKRMDRVKLGFRHGAVLALSFTALAILGAQLFGQQIISAFVSDKDVIALGGEALRLTSWFYLTLAMIYVARGILNGIGDALFAFINGFVEVLCRIFLPMLIMLIPGSDIMSIWWTVGITWALSALCCNLRYVFWRRKQKG